MRQVTAVNTTPIQVHDFAALTRSFPILVSDDEPGILTLTKYMLERSGLTAVAALDPLDTIHICQTTPVSLVISDVRKPGLSGLSMLDRLRSDPATASLPVIFVTACGSDLLQTPHELDGYLLKPCTSQELLELVHAVLLTRGRWERPAKYDPQVAAALTDTSQPFASGAWHSQVWTTRQYRQTRFAG